MKKKGIVQYKFEDKNLHVITITAKEYYMTYMSQDIRLLPTQGIITTKFHHFIFTLNRNDDDI